MTLVGSLTVGGIVAMSSTALVMKQLADQSESKTRYGLNAISILLFQDLAVVPILILIASFTTPSELPLWASIGLALGKGIVAVLLMIGVGRWLLKPLFHLIASTKVIELFTLSVIFVAISSAWLTHQLGLSYALGAFIAGVMLAETEYQRQIKHEIRPFRDVLLGLFFVSIGLLVNPATWPATWIWIGLLLVGLLIGKSVLIIVLCRLSKQDSVTATQTGLILAQGGEFGFAILSLALTHHLLPVDYGQVILSTLLISFALAPLLIRYHQKIVRVLCR